MDMAQRSELGRALQTFSVHRAGGERALVTAIIGYAARDALDGDAAAAAWFLSNGYRWYLDLLGLPPEWLPVGLDRAGLVERAAGRVEGAGRRSTWPAGSQIVTDCHRIELWRVEATPRPMN